MTDFVERLRAALGGSYAIERELGGGGMSRVFVAEDRALERPVVIKVLHPELAAGVNVDRFKREVQLLARLQHPHIVPILSAGEADGLPYYVMPFVRGESLRARLERGPLAPAEAAGLLADVAKALAAAHAEGIVHRDIKPDNILVSGGAAVVADFGIAKALSSARLREDAGTLTSLGTSLGTPAYMAPEQVAGDPNVDARADLYSLGCVAYEALTGASPFAGKTPQAMLAAQVIETPAPIASHRDGIPPALAAVVMKCLEKEPANRPQSATELAALLDTGSATDPRLPALPRPSRSRRGVWAAAASILVIAVVALGAYRWRRAERRVDPGISVAVAPFEVLDPRLALWKEGMVDVLSRNVDGAGPIRAISPSVAVKQWEGRADRASATAFAKKVGAQVVLYGQLQSIGNDLVDAKVWIANADGDAAPIEVDARDSSSRMDRITDSLSVRVLSVLGREHTVGPARLASLGSGSLPAIKAFLQGSQYFRRTQWDSAAASFQEAVALDTSFAIAYGMLGQALGWTEGGGSTGSTAAYTKAGDLLRPGISPRDSLLIMAMKHYSAGSRPGYGRANELRQAFEAAGAAANRYPNDAHVLYAYADVRYHGDPTITDDEAARLFDRAVQADSDFAPAWVHAVELSFRRGAEVGRRYTQSYLARSPRDVEARGLEVAANLADPALRARERAAIIDSLTPEVARRAMPALYQLADSAESAVLVMRAMLRKATPEMRRNLTSGLISALSMRGHVSEAWSLAVEHKSYIAAEIAGLGLVPTDSALGLVRPWLDRHDDASLVPIPLLALAHDSATLLRTASAIDSMIPKVPTPFQRALMSYFASVARAYAAMANNDTATATRRFESLPDSIVAVPLDRFYQARLIARQDPRRAIKLLQTKSAADLLTVARALEEARLAERLGQRELAVEQYARVADLWRNADAPQLRDARDEARSALQRLDADGRMRGELTRP